MNDFSILTKNKQLIREIHFCWLLSPLCRRDERNKTKHAYEPAGNKYYHESHEKRISTMKINNLNVNLMLNFFLRSQPNLLEREMFSKCSNFKSTSQSRFKQDKQIFIEILYLSLKKNIYYPFCFSFLSISSSSIKTLLIHSCESYSSIYIERSISVCHEIMKKRFRVAACLYINRTQMRPK